MGVDSSEIFFVLCLLYVLFLFETESIVLFEVFESVSHLVFDAERNGFGFGVQDGDLFFVEYSVFVGFFLFLDCFGGPVVFDEGRVLESFDVEEKGSFELVYCPLEAAFSDSSIIELFDEVDDFVSQVSEQLLVFIVLDELGAKLIFFLFTDIVFITFDYLSGTDFDYNFGSSKQTLVDIFSLDVLD